MSPAVLCIVMATVALEYGYEPMPDGDGIRYIIQIEPEQLERLRQGESVGSTIPPDVRGRLEEFQIVSGDSPLSKEIPPQIKEPAVPSPPVMPPLEVSTAVPRPLDIQSLAHPLPSETGSEPASGSQTQGEVVAASGTEPVPSEGGPSGVDASEGDEEGGTDLSKTASWPLMFLAMVIAAGSSSGMLFFGWLAYDYRCRYLTLLRTTMETDDDWMAKATGDESTATDSLRDEVPTLSDTESLGQEAEDDTGWQSPEKSADDSVEDWLREDTARQSRQRKKHRKSG